MTMHWQRRLRSFAFLGLSSAALASGVGAQTWTLTFEPANREPPNNYFLTYGSQPGTVAVRYRTREDWGLSSIINNEAYYWPSGYNDLIDNAYFASGPNVGEILLDNLVAGQQVTINSADVGAWPSLSETVQFRVYDLLGNLLFQQNGNTVGTTTHAHFVPGISNADGLLIQYSQVIPTAPNPDNPVDAYNDGIDNVSFTIGPINPNVVPEPSTFVLLAGGLAATAAAARRRRAR